jgi:uncharacterized protein
METKLTRKLSDLMLSEELRNILACPACKGELHASSNEQYMLCRTCGLAFPIREGIPVMLVNEATHL